MTPHIITKAHNILAQTAIGIGLALITVALLIFDNSPWPSLLTILPVGYFWICAGKVEDFVIGFVGKILKIALLLIFLLNVFLLLKSGGEPGSASHQANTVIMVASVFMFIGRKLPDSEE